MTGSSDRVEVITWVQRRRRWSAEEKAAIVQETYAPGMSVSLVARRHGIAPNQLFRWRRLYAEGDTKLFNQRQNLATWLQLAVKRAALQRLQTRHRNLAKRIVWNGDLPRPPR
jgi:transposase-like protein